MSLSQEAVDPAHEGEPVSATRQGEGASENQQNAQPEDYSTPDYTSVFDRIEATIRELIPEEYKEERQRQENREIADLSAQQDMALWAKRMFLATVAAVVVTGIGIVLVGRTLYHTRRAANFTKDMVREARETTKLTQFTLQSKRAWMCFERYVTHVHINSVLNGTRQPYYCLIKFIFINRGDGPAINTWAQFSHEIIPATDQMPKFNTKLDPEKKYLMTVGPGQEATFNAMFLLPPEIEKMKAQRFEMFIYCKITYNTQFPEITGETEVCMRFRHAKEHQDENGNPRHDFDATPIGPQNRTI